MLQDCSLSNVCFNINSSYTGENCTFCIFRTRTLFLLSKFNFKAACWIWLFFLEFSKFASGFSGRRTLVQFWKTPHKRNRPSLSKFYQCADERRDASEYGQWEYMENDVSSHWWLERHSWDDFVVSNTINSVQIYSCTFFKNHSSRFWLHFRLLIKFNSNKKIKNSFHRRWHLYMDYFSYFIWLRAVMICMLWFMGKFIHVILAEIMTLDIERSFQ